MTYHSPPVMVAIGPLDDEAEGSVGDHPVESSHGNATGVPPRCKAKMRQGKCRDFQLATPCAMKSAQIYLRVL